MNFEHFTPTRIVFGRGRIEQLGQLAKQYGKRAVVVCGRNSMRRAGILARVSDNLRECGIEVVVYDNISPNPRSDEVDACLRIVDEQKIDLVIGLGGGSALDAAKAVAVGRPYSSICEVIGKTIAPSPATLPLVAIPTTAGTGSEVTRGAILLDVERQFKSGIRGDDLYPKLAIVDPELTESLPRNVAIETGFDALTHAIESYLARSSNPITKALSMAAIQKLWPALTALAEGEVDSSVRDQLALGALLGGLNVAVAGSCLPHRLQQAMGSFMPIQLSHAQGLAIVYPSWLHVVEREVPELFPAMDGVIGSARFVESVCELIGRLQLDSSLRTHGYRRSDIDYFMKSVSGNLANDPIPEIDDSLIRAIYEAAY